MVSVMPEMGARIGKRYALVALHGGVPAIALDSFPATIGRGHDADLRFEDIFISRAHCQVDKIGDRLIVRDLGSKNGTFVNGVRTEFSPLQCGNVLTIGSLFLVVQVRAGEPSDAACSRKCVRPHDRRGAVGSAGRERRIEL